MRVTCLHDNCRAPSESDGEYRIGRLPTSTVDCNRDAELAVAATKQHPRVVDAEGKYLEPKFKGLLCLRKEI
jgi:hypothetical protein